MGCNKEPKKFGSDKAEPCNKGWILEDVWIDKKEEYEDWEPHVQALKTEEGTLALRFCYYKRKPGGKKIFVRAPMHVYDWTLEDLKEEAIKHKAEIILGLFKKLSE